MEQPTTSGRVVVQVPGTPRHRLQPRWVNPGGHRERYEQVRPYLTGRSVLDVGCASGSNRPDWVHALIAADAREVVGVDVDPGAVAAIRERGYEVELADAETMDLRRQFDVVFAGELIEHLDNPGGFLRAARRHLRSDSTLVLTTPNPFCFTNFVYRIGGKPKMNRDHTCWYCEDTLRQLLDRNGLAVVEVRYLHHQTMGRRRAMASSAVRRVLPDRLAWNTLLVVARPS